MLCMRWRVNECIPIITITNTNNNKLDIPKYANEQFPSLLEVKAQALAVDPPSLPPQVVASCRGSVANG